MFYKQIHFQYFKQCTIIAILKMLFQFVNFNPKKAEWSQFDISPSEFFKIAFSRERVKLCYFVTFNIIIRLVFSEISLKFLKPFVKYEGFLRLRLF